LRLIFVNKSQSSLEGSEGV